MSNGNLNVAKQVKNDEFYTRIEDIEKELEYYPRCFEGKTILMPCDDPVLLREIQGLSTNDSSSQFWVFFHKNFEKLKIKKIIATHYSKDGSSSYKIEYSGGADEDIMSFTKTHLVSNGDFRSEEVLSIMDDCDVVVTNPPFSLFREFINVLVSKNLDYLVIGSKGSASYKNVFKEIKDGNMRWGVNFVNDFITPSGTLRGVPTIWYTSLMPSTIPQKIILTNKFNENHYDKFDNYNAINIDKVKDIPMDYDGVMGVPITFLKRHNPSQFKIVGIMATSKVSSYNMGYPFINGKRKYSRLLIKNLSPSYKI